MVERAAGGGVRCRSANSRRQPLSIQGAFGRAPAVAVAASAVAVLVERILWGSWSCFRKNVWQNNFSWLCEMGKRVNDCNTLPFSFPLLPSFIFLIFLFFSSHYFSLE
jgi:hypothetical protein